MGIREYNQRRFNHKKQWYRFLLGIRQLKNYPAINLIWIAFVWMIILLFKAKEKLLSAFTMSYILATVCKYMLSAVAIIIIFLMLIGIVQVIGEMTARKDEADIYKVFADNRELRFEAPILVYKRRLKKKNVTVREFYTTIPMKLWLQKKDALCDILNVHLIGEIEYSNANGNRILIKSVNGRKTVEREPLYDDTF